MFCFRVRIIKNITVQFVEIMFTKVKLLLCFFILKLVYDYHLYLWQQPVECKSIYEQFNICESKLLFLHILMFHCLLFSFVILQFHNLLIFMMIYIKCTHKMYCLDIAFSFYLQYVILQNLYLLMYFNIILFENKINCFGMFVSIFFRLRIKITIQFFFIEENTCIQMAKQFIHIISIWTKFEVWM